jgi:integrase
MRSKGLYKRGSVWWMCFSYQGKFIRKSTETKDKKLAERIYRKLMGEVAEGKWFDRLPGDEKAFPEMIEKYLKEHSARNKAMSTHRRDKSLAGHLLAFFGDAVVSGITPKMITEYKTRRRDEGAAAQTVNQELAMLRHAFNLAIREWEWVGDNPAQKVSREKVHNLIERWLTFEEEEKLVAVCPGWLQEILFLGIETGMRQGELLALRWPQVNLAAGTLAILEQKNRRADTLPLSQKALEVLKARDKVRYFSSDLVFYTANGTQICARNLARAFYSARKKAGIKGLRWHDATRHTFATRLVQNGADIYTVQKLGRWKSTSMVMRYAHHHSGSLRPGIEVLDRARVDHITKISQLDGAQESANP